MSIMVTIEDPAHAKMAASMGRIQMTVQWLLYDLVLTQNVSLSIPQACVLRLQPGLYSGKDILNDLEKLFSRQ